MKASQGVCQKKEGCLSTTVDTTKIWQMPTARGSSKFEREYKAWGNNSPAWRCSERGLPEAMNFKLGFEG